jgi:hypothetical protein
MLSRSLLESELEDDSAHSILMAAFILIIVSAAKNENAFERVRNES